MIKEEDIQKHYGINYRKYKDVIDENGWNQKRIFNHQELDFSKFQYKETEPGVYISRPKALKCIENKINRIKIEVYIGFWHDFQIFENGIMKFSSKFLGYQSFWDAPNLEEWQVSHPCVKEAIRYSKELLKIVGAKDFKEWFKTIEFNPLDKYPYRFDRYSIVYINFKRIKSIL